MAFNVTVTPIVQEVEVNASVTPYEVNVSVIDSPILDLTTNGTSGDATFDPFTGVLNIPNYTTDLSGVVPTSRTLTINGTAFDLSANRSWTVGDLLSSGSYSNPSWITSLGWNKIASTPTTLSGYGISDAYTTGQVDTLLSAKQNNIILTTTGSSGASTLVGATLNIPNYTLSGLGGIGGTLATGQVAFGSGTNTVAGSNNLFWDSANGRLGIGTNLPSYPLHIVGSQNSISVLASANTVNDSVFWAGGTVSGAIFPFRANVSASGLANVLLDNTNNSTGSLSIQIRVPQASSGDPYLTFSTSGANNFSIGMDNSDGDNIKMGYQTNPSGTNPLLVLTTSNNVIINSSTDAGFRLDVNGTARVQGNTTITGSSSTTSPILSVTNTGSGNFTFSVNNSGSGNANFGLQINGVNKATIGYDRTSNFLGFFLQDATSTYFLAHFNSDGSFQKNRTSDGTADFKIFNGGGTIVGASTLNSSAQLQIDSTTKGFLPPRMTSAQRNAIATPATGLLAYQSTNNALSLYNGSAWADMVTTSNYDGMNIAVGTTTGTKIGTSTSQKLSLWNATPDVQPTTAIVASAFVANTSGITDDTATFGGYTIGQVVAALRRIGALA